ncbi:MAG TPA: L-serine ammonia-lyase [Microbacteriaceae bacterium]|nr:L-serine ammonia-lyase [Microbacteriaceae bacterium]
MSAFVSVAELFSVGIGPSSSHTVGPMRAAAEWVRSLAASGRLGEVTRISVTLCGSLGATGIGHGTPDAVIAGLRGDAPETVEPDRVHGVWQSLGEGTDVLLAGGHPIRIASADIRLAPLTRLPGHPNALIFRAFSGEDEIADATYFSIGGGFIRRDGDPVPEAPAHPLPYSSSANLLELCRSHTTDHAGIAWRNEVAIRGEAATLANLDAIWDAMFGCIEAGMRTDGVLPGSLNVSRRAAKLAAALQTQEDASTTDWLQAFALAVNEENAAGQRVVTAPTNGSAGIIPAVAMYYMRFSPRADRSGIHRFLLTAAAIGSVIKANASISGAEGGCQAEVGSACAMAAAGLCALLGGTPEQVENAAEIAIEHHLGLTCDPVGGLVQVPCIERNAIAASTAVAAARLARNGDGTHIVSLDTAIETMRQTGADMSHKYKETAEGGLAVNVVEC